MKQTLSIILLITVMVTVQSGKLNSAPVVSYIDTLSSWYGCNVAESLGLPKQSAKGANVIALSFWTSNQGPADAVKAWAEIAGYIPSNCGYGSSNSQIQENLIKKFHEKGMKVIVAAFGATDYPTSRDPTQTCAALAKFVLANKLDGVDLDYEDSGAFEQGRGAKWLTTCTRVIRQYLPEGKYILTHAPQGPYFTTARMYPDGAYRTIDKEVGQMIDWYNLQYYNQGDNTYTSYEDCFVKCKAFPGTAVLELKGMKSKIAVGKPVLKSDASNGWVSASTLASWLTKANKEAGWCGGAMYWQGPSDANGSFGAAMRGSLNGFSGGCNGKF